MSESSTFATLRTTLDGAVGALVLERPDRLNAMSRQMLLDLAGAARWFDDRPQAKVVVVRGHGRSFCAGFDLDDFVTPDTGGLSLRAGADLGRQMAEAVTGMRALTVAAVHGHCVGGGLVLAASCDIRIAADDARFSIPEVDLGIPLAWGGIPRLVREIGPAFTKELVLTCRPFSAHEAMALRFCNRVVPAPELVTAADALAAELATKPAFALTMTKQHVNAVAEAMGPTRFAFTDADVLASALADEESRAVGRAYLERRRR